MIDLMTSYWQFTLVGVLILISAVINMIDKKFGESGMDFVIDSMPVMMPMPIPTKGKGFWAGVKIWILETRKWELQNDFVYRIDGTSYTIPAGFVFDGASVPKFFRSWLSPMGVLLVGGLVHDYGYKYETLLHSGKKSTNGSRNQKWMDETFRDINISVNGFRTINYLAYYALRLGGFVAWNGHRKVNAQWKDSIKKVGSRLNGY